MFLLLPFFRYSFVVAFDVHGGHGLAEQGMMVVVDFRYEDDGLPAPVEDFRLRPGGFPCPDVFDEVGGDVQRDRFRADGTADDADGGVRQCGEGAAVGEAGQVDMDVGVDGHVELRPAAAHLVDDNAAMDDVAVRAEDFLYYGKAVLFVQGNSLLYLCV